MTEENYLNIVSQTNAAIDNLWTETIENEAFRELVIKHLTTNDISQTTFKTCNK